MKEALTHLPQGFHTLNFLVHCILTRNVLLLQTDGKRRARLLALSASALDASVGDAFRPVVRRMISFRTQLGCL